VHSGDIADIEFVTHWFGGPAVFTTILAYLIAFTGLAMIAAGTWGALILISEKRVRIGLRYYAAMLAMMACGLGLVGLGQALRLLLVINAKG
jgi:hypothetical protein